MRQIARWYDVEVKYEGNVDRIEFGGEIGRNLTLQQVLNGLQDKDLHFRLEGKKNPGSARNRNPAKVSG